MIFRFSINILLSMYYINSCFAINTILLINSYTVSNGLRHSSKGSKTPKGMINQGISSSSTLIVTTINNQFTSTLSTTSMNLDYYKLDNTSIINYSNFNNTLYNETNDSTVNNDNNSFQSELVLISVLTSTFVILCILGIVMSRKKTSTVLNLEVNHSKKRTYDQNTIFDENYENYDNSPNYLVPISNKRAKINETYVSNDELYEQVDT